MDRKNKILELLEKKNPSEQEIKELQNLAANDEEIKDFISTYNELSRVVKHSSHLSDEEISEYILFKNEAPGEENTLIARIPFIESHLRDCSKCSEIFKELNSEYGEIDNFLAENPLISESADKNDTSAVPLRKNFRTPRYVFASIILIGLIYISLYVISSYTTPSYFKYALLMNESDISINRGRTTENFQNSLKALENKNYGKAINFLQMDIKQNPGDETIFYSYYILGLSYLKTAEHDFLGLFPGYNLSRAQKGKEYLEKSIARNNSGRFINIKLNSYFYLAKASLMLNDKESTKKYLSLVINEKGSKMDEAKKLLGEME